MAVSEKATDDNPRRFLKVSKGVGLLEGMTLVLKAQPSNMGKARNGAVLDHDGRSREEEVLDALVRMFSNEQSSLKRRWSMNCEL